MQIQLKQDEIIIALKQYVASQGIDLQNKSVGISFTTSRKPFGIIADIEIDTMIIPGFDDEVADDKPEVTQAPVLRAIEGGQEERKSFAVKGTDVFVEAKEPDPEPEVEEAKEEEPKPKTTSLFS